MKRVISFFVVILLVVIATVIVNNKKQDKVTISIGYQVPTAQVWSALIIKNQKLYEYYLKKDKQIPHDLEGNPFLEPSSRMHIEKALTKRGFCLCTSR